MNKNKTKIIATIGPASQDIEIIKKLIQNGLDVVRINLSHADYSFCKDIIEKVKKLNKELNTSVAIMLDTKGREIRVGNMIANGVYLKKDDTIKIYKQQITGDSTRISTTYPNLVNEVKFNTIIKLDDGKIELQVIDKEDDFLVCKILNDGFLKSNKGINIPGFKLKMDFLNEKDKQDIMFANEMGVDFIAASFVNSAEDILEINDLLIALDNDHIGIIAKIENEHSVKEIDDIIRVADGVMVARGDLGVEVPLERLPGIQKSIINKCHLMGKVSIVATEMLASMEHGLRPTRAEVSDVANAVMDGADTVMLSGETTIGLYPVETVAMMERIIASSEENIEHVEMLDKAMRTENQDTTGSIAYSVAEVASRLNCSAIIAPTVSGYTARKLSRFRPVCPIIAVSPNESTIKSLALHFGVHGVKIDNLKSLDEIIDKSIKIARQKLTIEDGEKVIITGGYPFEKVKHTNFMKIEEI